MQARRVAAVALVLVLTSLLAQPAASLPVEKHTLWEGETAVVSLESGEERFTLVSVGPKGERATLRVETAVDEDEKTVGDGDRITYGYKEEDGYEHMRSIMIHDVSRIPPRVEIWLPEGRTSEKSVSVLAKASALAGRLAELIL